jgi:hypothetical protein
LIIRHGYFFEELDNIMKGKDIYDVWLEIIRIYKLAQKRNIQKGSNVRRELSNYYDESQSTEAIALSYDHIRETKRRIK